ncbi:MAG: helix-turn-helix domain-containing protein [Caldimonas sp.]
MSEGADATRVAGAPSAGRLLREAREKQGLHIAALAASIKVSPKKLEMLEADRFDALPDATFTRALAQTVCRALKIDPAVILSLLPPVGHRLEQLGGGLNTPFRERPGALGQREGSGLSLGPWFWITGLVLLAALGVFFMPSGTLRMPPWAASRAAAPVASEPTVVSSDSAILPGETVAASAVVPQGSVPALSASEASPSVSDAAQGLAAVAAATPNDASAGVVQVRTSEPSWVEITDARGRSLVARVVAPGEALGVDGEPPFRLRIGNAGGTRVSFHGQPMELAAYTRDNVARFELK